MMELILPRAPRRPTRILCIGAHCDDVEIGCGGTLLRLLGGGGRYDITWAVFSATPERERELRASARRFLRRAHSSRLLVWRFRDSFFPADYARVKEAFGSLQQLPSPDLVFTHHRCEEHQDHRLLGELTWNAFRRHLILEYEIPKYEGGLTTPNAYVQLPAALAARKVRNLISCYRSQHSKPWFQPSTFEALMRLRGIEAGPGSGWAEGFHAAKLNLG